MAAILKESLAFGPERAIWSYAAPDKRSLYSMIIAGAQRLPNGDTFICSGIAGVLFEVTANKDIVWNYSISQGGGGPGGTFGPGGMPGQGGMFGPGGPGGPPGSAAIRPGELFPATLPDTLQCTDEQKAKLTDLQKRSREGRAVADQGSARTIGSTAVWLYAATRRPGRLAPPRPGEVIPATIAQSLTLSKAQTDDLAAFQKEVDDELSKILTKEQQTKLSASVATASGAPNRGGPGGGRGGAGRGGRGGGFGGMGGPGGMGFGGMGPGGMGGIFTCFRYAPDFPGLVGKDLTPGKKLEELMGNQRPSL